MTVLLSGRWVVTSGSKGRTVEIRARGQLAAVLGQEVGDTRVIGALPEERPSRVGQSGT